MSAPVDVLAVWKRPFEAAALSDSANHNLVESALVALDGMLSDYEDTYGEGYCECRPEPENVGHVCNACQARTVIRDALARVQGGDA